MKSLSFDNAVYLIQSGWIYLGLIVAVVTMFLVGFRFGLRTRLKTPETTREVSGIFISSIFGFFAILIAFQLSGSTQIYEATRKIIIEEISSISTVISLSKSLGVEERKDVASLLGQYLDDRVTLYEKPLQISRFIDYVNKIKATGEALWLKANDWAIQSNPESRHAHIVFLAKVQEMNTAFNHQALSFYVHSPRILWQALVVLLLISSVICGYKTGIEKASQFPLTLVFLFVVVGAIFICLNLGHPRLGVVDYEQLDPLFMNLRNSLKL